MTISAAQLMVTVGANTGGAEQAISRLSGMLGPGGILKMGIVGTGVAMLGIGVASVKMAGDFQASMVQLVTGAGESQSNLKMVSDGILKMAVDTGESTKQLADGMFMIESAGYHGADALTILKAAAEGAKVGNADLGTTADALTTIMKDYGDTGITATQATNTLIATVANGKTHMQDLASSLAEILPTASTAKVGLNDVMGAMATMTGEGVPAANAATYLRQLLLALDAPSGQAKKALESVGLSSEQVAAEMQKSLPGALQMIQDAVAKKFPVGSAQYVAAMKDIAGGSRQMQGILDLTGNHLKDFQDNTDKVSGAVKKGGDQVAGWNLVQGTFNDKMARAKEVVQTLFIKLGTNLLPIVGQLADAFSKDVPAALDALGPVVEGIAKSFGDGKGLGGVMDGVGKFIRTVAIPIIKDLAKIFIRDVLPAINSVAHFVVTEVLPALTKLGVFIEQKVMPVVATLAHVFVKDVLPALENVAKTVLDKLLPPLEKIMGKILPVLNPLFKFLGFLIKEVVGPALSGLINVLAGIATGFNDVLDFLGKVKDHLGDIPDAFHKAFDTVWDIAKAPLNLVIGGINAIIDGLDHIKFKVPGWVPGVGGKGFSIDIPKIPKLATGGNVLSGGMAMVGENGPELVSLPTGARVFNNQQSAGIAAGAQMVQVTTQINLDGRRVAQVVTKHMPDVIRNATGARSF